MVRKWLIETAIISLAVGSYIFYGQPLVDTLKSYFPTLGTTDSVPLYAVGAFIVIALSTLFAKMLTRGMK